MTIGLALTAVVAWLVFQSGLYITLMPFWMIIAFSLMGVSLYMGRKINRLATTPFTSLTTLFLIYSGLEGVFFGTVLPVYAASFGGQVIWAAFGTAALVFGLAVAYGAMTKSDLTSLGRILSRGVMGLVAATILYVILSFFMPVTGLMLLISYIGVVLFVGLSAYDAQKIKQMSQQVDGYSAQSCKLSLVMALRMYMNVILIFWYLLQIFSSSSKR